jgi:uncharacterized protein
VAHEVIFADTSFWIALLNPLDAYHFRAMRLAGEAETRKHVTSDYVLIELLNHFSQRQRPLRTAAFMLARGLRSGDGYGLVRQSEQLFAEGLELYGSRADKSWSFVDCTSFALMNRLSISQALSSDHHFEQAGYSILLG